MEMEMRDGDGDGDGDKNGDGDKPASALISCELNELEPQYSVIVPLIPGAFEKTLLCWH